MRGYSSRIGQRLTDKYLVLPGLGLGGLGMTAPDPDELLASEMSNPQPGFLDQASSWFGSQDIGGLFGKGLEAYKVVAERAPDAYKLYESSGGGAGGAAAAALALYNQQIANQKAELQRQEILRQQKQAQAVAAVEAERRASVSGAPWYSNPINLGLAGIGLLAALKIAKVI